MRKQKRSSTGLKQLESRKSRDNEQFRLWPVRAVALFRHVSKDFYLEGALWQQKSCHDRAFRVGEEQVTAKHWQRESDFPDTAGSIHRAKY